jgi:hypothetical protein
MSVPVLALRALPHADRLWQIREFEFDRARTLGETAPAFAELEGASSLAQQPFGGAAIPGERVRAPLRGGAPARRADRTSGC